MDSKDWGWSTEARVGQRLRVFRALSTWFPLAGSSAAGAPSGAAPLSALAMQVTLTVSRVP